MTHHDRNAHMDLIATARGMYPRNLPVSATKPDSSPWLYYGLVLAIASALFWSL